MKNLLISLIVIAVVGLGAWYLLSRSIVIDLPFPTKHDQVKVTITRPDIPNTLRITNKADLALKIQMFNAADKVRLVPRAQWTLKPNQSVTYGRDNYRYKVFKPALFDKLMATSDVIGSDVVLEGNKNGVRITGTPKKLVTFISEVDEQVKVCTYNAGDFVQAIPLQCWTFGPGRRISWDGAPPTFIFKVFRPQFLDKPLAMESDVRDQSDITIH